MLDHLGPVHYRPGEAVGAPDHPHRGQETVTIVLEGGFQHLDSAGHSGTLGPGWVQWMTAGKGVIHSEMPSDELMEHGGTMEGFQLWVNLPSREKMCEPRYQDIPPEKIPLAEAEGAIVRVITGECLGQSAVIETKTPITVLDIRLAPGATLTQPLPSGYRGFVYMFRGAASIGTPAVEVNTNEAVDLVDGGDELVLSCSASAKTEARMLLCAGQPLDEPIAWHGPFVMNTHEEIEQTIEDYQLGKLAPRLRGERERLDQTRKARAKQEL